SRNPKVDLDHLTEAELRDLESASYHLINTAMERRPEGIERRGFTLADVAVLSPPTYSLDRIQRVFGYLRAVLEADLRPENLRLTPDVEELARKALLLPAQQRTLFQLVRTLRVGLYKARLIKAVESAGGAVHAPLPTIDLGAFSPEFSADHSATSHQDGAAAGESFFAPENEPPRAHSPASADRPAGSGTEWALPPAHAQSTRCVGCGGIASIVHQCGAPVCQHCIAEFHTCPKCQQPISSVSSRPVLDSEPTPGPAGVLHHASHGDATKASHHPLKAVLSRARLGGTKPVAKPAHEEAGHPDSKTDTKGDSKNEGAHPKNVAHPTSAQPAHAPTETPGADAPPKTPRPAHPREKPDEEPRL
ncbi:MAG: hypothetical protein L3J96_04135, partial [Thermoplasmata archaeon]|nr:hypothetical protein [Thermoplasmata archaeon]